MIKKGLIKKGRLRPVNSDRGNKERSQRSEEIKKKRKKEMMADREKDRHGEKRRGN